MIDNPILAMVIVVALWAAAMEHAVWGPARRAARRSRSWLGWRGPGS